MTQKNVAVPVIAPATFFFGEAPQKSGRKKGNNNLRVWYILLYKCRRGHYPAGMTLAKDRRRMERYYDQHKKMSLAAQAVAAERRGEHFDPGDIGKN